MKYAEIRDMDSLDAARREISEKLDVKGKEVIDSLRDVRETCTPAGLIAAGIRRLSGTVPLDRIVLTAIRVIKSRL